MFRRRKHRKKLLKDFEAGKVLQVDNNTDNKEFFKSLEEKKDGESP